MKFIIGVLTIFAVGLVLLTGPPMPGPKQPVPKIATLDATIQAQAQSVLDRAMAESQAKDGLVLVMDAQTGEIQALASTDSDLAAQPWQPGSVAKPLLMAAALNEGAVTPQSRYYDAGTVSVDGFTIRNVLQGAGQRSMQDVLNFSLNTGAVYILKQLGGGQLNDQARQIWYRYLTEHYQFARTTHTGLPGEAAGYVREPSNSRNSSLAYVSSAFGVNVTVSPIRLMSDYAALVNGGNYHEPAIVRQSPLAGKQVISSQSSATITAMLEKVAVFRNISAPPGYVVGVKSGTAPATDDIGNYTPYGDNGSFIGFIGRGRPEQIILVRLDQPVTKNNAVASMVVAPYWIALANSIMSTPHDQN